MAERRLDVALLAYGGPQAPEEVVPFLRRLMGRAPSADTIAAVQERYALIGGASPLPAITARQARALQTELEQRRDESYRQRACAVRVRHGFLFSDPSVAECLRQLDADEIVAVPLSPFSSRLTSGRYTEQIAAAEAASGRGRTIPLLEGWYASPGFLRAVARRITASLDGCAADEWALLFTAHSVPAETIAAGDLYVKQLDEAMRRFSRCWIPAVGGSVFRARGVAAASGRSRRLRMRFVRLRQRVGGGCWSCRWGS